MTRTRMLYHDDPSWYQKPGQSVEVPLGPAVSATRHTVNLPWKQGKYDDVQPNHDAALFPRGGRQPWIWGDEMNPSPAYLALEDARRLSDDQTTMTPSQLTDPQLPIDQPSTEQRKDDTHASPTQADPT